MKSLAGLVVAGPLQAVLVIALLAALSFMAPPLTSVLAYGSAAALALYSLHAGAKPGAVVMLGSALVTGLLAEVVLHQGMAAVVTSLLLWVPVWLAAMVLRGTGSLAMSLLVLAALGLLGVTAIFVLFGDPSHWWVQRLETLAGTMAAQPELAIGEAAVREFIAAVAPLMTGAMAAGLVFAAATCVIVGRWWQSMLFKPGALRGEVYALRLNRSLSMLGILIVGLAALELGVVSSIALQWSLIIMVPFLFVGLAVVHATLANLSAAKGWLIGLYILMGLVPQVLLMVILVGIVDPWLELRRRTARSGAN